MKKIILASGSPRRKMLLEKLGIDFEIVVSDKEEILNPSLRPVEQAAYLSKEKAKEVSKKVKGSVIIAADTTVVIEDLVLGKPKNKNEAIEMLKKLSGKMHNVITGFTVLDQYTGRNVTRSSVAKLWFRELNILEIKKYIEKYKPYDKAGGYGIQDIDDLFVEKMEGDYSAILGLPLVELSNELGELGIKHQGLKTPFELSKNLS